MEMPSTLAPLMVLLGQSRVIRAFGDEMILHLGGEQTAGRFAMFTNVTPPGGGPPPHYHLKEDEWFFVLEGRASFLQDGAWTEVPAGSCVFMPKGAVHTFKNVGDAPLRQLIHTSPSGFETFFARCEAEFNQPSGPDMNRILQIADEHGIHFAAP
jgi:quercetin dioxygenase-like cupin family protein